MEYLAVLLPSATLAVLFYFVMRSILNADRAEREALTKAREPYRSETRLEDPAPESGTPDPEPENEGPNSTK